MTKYQEVAGFKGLRTIVQTEVGREKLLKTVMMIRNKVVTESVQTNTRIRVYH